MIRRIIALALSLCLTLAAFPALAAPTRDLQDMELELTEGLQSLTEIAAWSAVWDRYAFGADMLTLNTGEAPNPGGAARAMYEAARRDGITGPLSPDDAKNLYAQLFTEGEFAPSDDISRFFDASEGGIALRELHPAPGNYGGEGVYIYAVRFDGVNAAVQCDLYELSPQALNVETPSAEDAPEDMLTWAYHMELSLRYAPETEYGYTLNGISLSPAYRDGNFGDWWEMENADREYSVQIPGSLDAVDDTPDRMVLQNSGKDVTLTIEARKDSLTYTEALARFMQAHPGRKVKQEKLYDAFTLLEEGCFSMVVTTDDYPWTFAITFTFPAERQAEYAFYAEIIRNSFVAWRLSNG